MKISALLTVCTAACAAVSLVSCSSAPESSSASSQRQKRISSSPLNEELIGSWFGEYTGYRFQEDRKVSLLMDFTPMLHFNKDGSFTLSDETLPAENISYDGTTLSVIYTYTAEEAEMYGLEESEVDVLTLERRDSSEPDTFDGTYSFVSGAYIDIIAGNLAMNADEVTLTAEISGDEFRITVEDYCDYETLGDSLEMFSENLDYVDETATAVKYKFAIDGDTLTLTYNSGSTDSSDEDESVEVLKRID